ncbi:MAG TPA: hypothetical protein ENI17_16185 [Pseudomonas xinjiangensis]|uniref:Uncharacterized protein n=1 Tax=Halopseudomonas xinjiangensis TaxID=487184 RepID=A0A7V1BM68_9GAMM|nr:hypothetical protein [Halopseudomonas xinjiangensis]HEC49142.1 hypothetical protein [Halopseudomonas xinjiangensis]
MAPAKSLPSLPSLPSPRHPVTPVTPVTPSPRHPVIPVAPVIPAKAGIQRSAQANASSNIHLPQTSQTWHQSC